MSPTKHAGRPRAKRPTDLEQLALSSLRRRPSQQRGVQRVVDVLDAFERLLAQKRFEDITMDDLSRAARIQIGSLYHFFPDITSVILTVLERALADEGAAFEGRPEDDGLGFGDYLAALERRVAGVWHSHAQLLGVLFAYQRHPLIWKVTLEQRERSARLIGSRLQLLMPGLGKARAVALGRMIGMVMAVLIDNLEYLPENEGRQLRRETHAMLSRYVAAEARSRVGGSDVKSRRRLVRRAVTGRS